MYAIHYFDHFNFTLLMFHVRSFRNQLNIIDHISFYYYSLCLSFFFILKLLIFYEIFWLLFFLFRKSNQIKIATISLRETKPWLTLEIYFNFHSFQGKKWPRRTYFMLVWLIFFIHFPFFLFSTFQLHDSLLPVVAAISCRPLIQLQFLNPPLLEPASLFVLSVLSQSSLTRVHSEQP